MTNPGRTHGAVPWLIAAIAIVLVIGPVVLLAFWPELFSDVGGFR